MAFTVTKTLQTVLGDQRVWMGVLTADAATGVVSFGFGAITHVEASAKSMASSVWNVQANLDASGTASNGDLAVTGVTSGDDIYVTVYGR